MNQLLPIVGNWWLPNNSRKRITGRLYKDHDHGLCLEINGLLFDFEKLDETFGIPINFIYGKSTTQEIITLKDSVLISHSGNSSTYQIYSCFFGKKFETLNDVRFHVVNVAFRNLNKWVMEYFFEDDFGSLYKKDHASISVHTKPIDLGEINGFRLRIKIRNIEQVKGRDIAGFHFNSSLEISTDEPRLFDEFLDISTKFSGFLSFATLKPVFISDMDGIIRHKRKKPDFINILLRYKENHYEDYSSRNYYGLFPFRFVEQNISKVVKNYFDLLEMYYPVYDLYLYSIRNPSSILENEFRNLVEGLEAYHRRRFSGKYISNEEYRREIYPLFLNVIPEDLEKNFKEKLKNSLKYMNEFSLRKRMLDLIKNLPEELEFKIQKEKGYQDDIIRNIVKIRNHFAHFDPNEKGFIPKDPVSLRLLNEEMRLILEANILQDFGFDIEHIWKFTRITKRFHH
jgi:hypothetical protein